MFSQDPPQLLQGPHCQCGSLGQSDTSHCTIQRSSVHYEETKHEMVRSCIKITRTYQNNSARNSARRQEMQKQKKRLEDISEWADLTPFKCLSRSESQEGKGKPGMISSVVP